MLHQIANDLIICPLKQLLTKLTLLSLYMYTGILYFQVKQWITINEPLTLVTDGYCSGVYAPGVTDCLGKGLRVAHNLILAHSAVYRLYSTKYRATQKGIGH